MRQRLKVSILGMNSTRISTGKLLWELFPGFLDIFRQQISVVLTSKNFYFIEALVCRVSCMYMETYFAYN